MTDSSLNGFFDALIQSRLLEPEQLDELHCSLRQEDSNPRQVARELARRYGLTPYQIDLLFQGRGQDLLLGQYILLNHLGNGGMGQVFKARHRLMRRIVALKVIRRNLLGNESAVRRFHREIQIASQLCHPNVVMAFDAAQEGDVHFLVMEYVEGVDLDRLVFTQGPLPPAKASDFIRQAASGLQHAHEKGMVHRDVKPANLLLAAHTGLIRVLDLGLARMKQESKGSTLEGAVVGTPDYMAPEQAENSRTVDIRADIYSLGCTLYYLLTGRPPFPGGNVLQKLVRHQLSEPLPVELLNPEVPPELSQVLQKMMAKRPQDRYQTPVEVEAVLAPFARPAPVRSGRGLELPPNAETPSPDLTPTPSSFDIGPRRGNSLGMTLTLIPSGAFVMGSPASETGRRDSEGPQHAVVISRPFYLGIYPVTVGAFRQFVEATGYKTEAERDGQGSYRFSRTNGRWKLDPQCTWRNPGWWQSDEHPVVCVSWNDAVAFCQWLSQKESRRYRLPTEAEWEYACRANSTTAFCYGGQLSARFANFDGTHPYGGARAGGFLGMTCKVGSYPPNAWGLYDMHGNVWEWCQDIYERDYYSVSPTNDPPGPVASEETDCRRVLRGGCWCDHGVLCRSAYRNKYPPSNRDYGVGFRVACSI